MGDLSVAGKKKIIRQLAEAYQSTRLSRDVACRMESSIGERLDNCSVYRRMPVWGIAVAAGVLLGIAVTIGLVTTRGAVSQAKAIAAHVEGTVTDSRGLTLSADAPLKQGDALHTSAKSRLTVALGHHRVELEENSDLSLETLKQNQLRFRVMQGKARFTVSKLNKNETLEVHAADVTVHVVGTRFSVANNGRCVEVAVSEGKVKTVRGKSIEFAAAGERRLYCVTKNSGMTSYHSDISQSGKSDSIAPKTMAPAVVLNSPARHVAQRTINTQSRDTDALSDVPVPTISHRAGQQSEDVLLFDNAHKALISGALSIASQLFLQYLNSYSDGEFAEDAAFRLVRIAFRQKDDAAVMRYSKNFMQTYGDAAGHRTAEVRILRARTLIKNGQQQSALEVLAPLRKQIAKQTPRHKHQVTALQFTAACETGMDAMCQKWANAYLSSWPSGSFIKSAKRYLKK